MKKVNAFVLLILMPFILFATPRLNVDKDGLALEGYDPISYFNNQPVKGKSEFKLVHQGATFYFHNSTNLETFKNSPSTYTPALGGWCAFAMLDGKKVEVNPKSFKIIDKQLYLFYDGLWGDTLKQWNKKISAGKNEADLVKIVQSNWSKLIE